MKKMIEILKRLLFFITIVPMVILCTFITVLVFVIWELVTPIQFIITGKDKNKLIDWILEDYTFAIPINWLADKLL